jgi:hypothetical protein
MSGIPFFLAALEKGDDRHCVTAAESEFLLQRIDNVIDLDVATKAAVVQELTVFGHRRKSAGVFPVLFSMLFR